MQDKKNLPNFAVVAPGIWRGAAPTTEGFKQLKTKGVRTIIDLRIEKKGQAEEEAATKALGLKRVRIPMGAEAPTEKQVKEFLGLLGKSATEPVFVHCQHGADRTGAMVGIWRVTQQGWGFDQTWVEMRKYGFKSWLKELKGAVEKRAKKK
ncbi:beta-lactamase hydrolase domain-containing protein [Armatimonas sp.]|uniref:fused DSP-PTPase phosphatase/NAD kinase-like protein n=1 Tax=Armatimonas sp. TaxID=1872638 RepID=UPI00286AFEF4|nr:sulfur transferase domain-containing protein [Armatimonas sp.]